MVYLIEKIGSAILSVPNDCDINHLVHLAFASSPHSDDVRYEGILHVTPFSSAHEHRPSKPAMCQEASHVLAAYPELLSNASKVGHS